MPRFRAPQIHSEKHESTWSNLIQDASSAVSIPLVTGVGRDEIGTNPDFCKVGSRVTTIYLEFHFANQDDTNPEPNVIHWVVECSRDGLSMGAPNVYNQDSKSYIVKRGMEMLPKDTSTVYKRIVVVRIPRIYQRVKLNTVTRLRYIATSNQVINTCGIIVYKEIY